MKNKISKIAIAMLSFIFVLSTCMTVLASTSLSVSDTQNGIEATLNFDKQEYVANEKVEVTLSIKNNNSYAINNIQTEIIIPNTMKLSTGSLTSETFSLNAEESNLHQITLDKVGLTNNDELVNNPQTEDNIDTYIVMMVISASILIVIASKKMPKKGVMSLFFTLALISIINIASVVKAESTTKEFTIEGTIKYDGEDIVIKGKVTYNYEANTYTIEAISGDNGDISPKGNIKVGYGENQEFVITADEDYYIDEVIVDGINKGAIESYKFENITSNHKIEVSFAKSAVCNDANCVSCPEKTNVCTECAENYELNSAGICEFKYYTECPENYELNSLGVCELKKIY